MFKTRIKLWLIQFRNVMKKDGNTKQLTVLVDIDEADGGVHQEVDFVE